MYRFGEVQVFPLARKVLVRGKPVVLSPRAYDLLIALIERRDRVISKDELLDAVWPGLAVEENNIHVHVSILRKALGHAFLVTIPGRGFHFAETVVEEAEAPEDARHPRPRTNLAPATEDLVGREAALVAVAELLRASRLVAVTGPGGMGKSRVAMEVARRCVPGYRHGVWCVDLANCATGDLVGSAIAAAAGIPLSGADPVADLEAALRSRETLLVLDGCERVVAQAAGIADQLLAACGGLRILATSQESLRLPEEHAFPLQSLALPPAGTPPAAAREFATLQLLVRRLHSLAPTYRLEDADVSCAVELCRRLDGLPLAIEMAAALVPDMGLKAVYERVAERLDLLHNPNREAPPRQQTLQASFDWSYSLLTPRERDALRRLAAIGGSFDQVPARNVLAAAGMGEWEALETLTALCDKSLVTVADGPTLRYRLPETTRLFALQAHEACSANESLPAVS